MQSSLSARLTGISFGSVASSDGGRVGVFVIRVTLSVGLKFAPSNDKPSIERKTGFLIIAIS